jgi:beta-galactosidase
MVTDTLLTAFEPFALALHPDRDRVHPNSGEVVHITTRVVDSAGILNPHSSHLVNYQLDGPGRIRVIDNGDLADHTPPGSAAREVRRGKQLLILQAGSEPGDLIISASAEGLKPSSVKIRSGK